MTANGAKEAVERLNAWLDSWSIGRFEKPIYNNPSELKEDVRIVLNALAEAKMR